MIRTRHSLLSALALLTACSLETPDWLGGAERVIKRAPGERIDVVLSPSHIVPDSEVADVAIEIPEQANLDNWRNHNDALRVPHLGLTGITQSDSVKIGDGMAVEGFSPRPVSIGQDVVVSVRPEKARLVEQQPANGTNVFPVTVERIAYIGSDTRMFVRLQGQPFTV